MGVCEMRVLEAMVAMKAMKGAAGNKALTKGAMADALSSQTGLKRKQCTSIIDGLAGLGAEQVKKNGRFTVPGVCMIKTRLKPATKAGKKEMFGKTVVVKAMKARTVVKAFPVSALKKVV